MVFDFAKFTQARIGLQTQSFAIGTKDLLKFQLDHALAKDAVNKELDFINLEYQIKTLNISSQSIQSQVNNKVEYLKRPDLGRKISEKFLDKFDKNKTYDICISIADGLSAQAIENHAFKLLQKLLSQLRELNYSIAPIYLVKYGRVAISDQIGVLANSKMSIILIGERPGLSSPDSLGVYLTYNPQILNTDEKRNCISNIRNEGMSYQMASSKLIYLINEAFRLKISGVNLKENQNLLTF